jgi:hypothetical protein
LKGRKERRKEGKEEGKEGGGREGGRDGGYLTGSPCFVIMESASINTCLPTYLPVHTFVNSSIKQITRAGIAFSMIRIF